MDLKQKYLSLETTNCLKGILAVIIIAGHLRNNLAWLNDNLVGQFFTASGYLAVAVFFFLSGYGMMFQYKKQGKKYIDNFPKKRLLDIYVKYIAVILIYCIYRILLGEKITVKSLIYSLTFGGTVAENGWYIQAIVVTYILFYLVLKLFHNKEKMLHLGFLGGFVLYCLLCKSLNLGGLWYQFYLAYPLGLAVAVYKDKIDEFLNKKYIDIIIMIISFFAFSVTLLLGNFNILQMPLKLIVKMFSSVFFTAFVLMILRHIKIENKITAFLGSISFELYVIHGLIYSFFHIPKFYINDVVYILLTYVCSIVSAVLLHKLFILISKKIKG